MHTILHPLCHLRLAEQLGLDPSEERLTVPLFALAGRSDGPPPPSDRGRPPRLLPEEKLAVQRRLDDLSARRKKSSAGLFRIDVDRRTVGFLDVEREPTVRIEVNEGAEIVEVIDPKGAGGTPLAACVLPLQTGDAHPTRLSIALEAGQRLSFEVRAKETADEGRVVEIRYEPGGSLSVSSLLAAMRHRLDAIGWKPALALGLLLTLAAGLALLLQPRVSAPEVPVAAARGKAVTPPPSAASLTNPTPGERLASADRRQEPIPRLGKAPREEIVTREGPTGPPALRLEEVRRIAIETSGGVGLGPGRQVEERIRSLLREGGRMTVTESREEADALLRMKVGAGGKDALVSVELLDAEGRRIWPGDPRRAYRGDARYVGEQISRDLERAIFEGSKKP